jgi:hypothetical protein
MRVTPRKRLNITGIKILIRLYNLNINIQREREQIYAIVYYKNSNITAVKSFIPFALPAENGS